MDNISISSFIRKHISDGVKILFFSPIIIFVLFFRPYPLFANETEITPERDISVVLHGPQSPDWKILWDGARNLVREQQYQLAADVYGQLFTIKPNIEEANWEYCKVLLQTEDYKTASKIISLLLEKIQQKMNICYLQARLLDDRGNLPMQSAFTD